VRSDVNFCTWVFGIPRTPCFPYDSEIMTRGALRQIAPLLAVLAAVAVLVDCSSSDDNCFGQTTQAQSAGSAGMAGRGGAVGQAGSGGTNAAGSGGSNAAGRGGSNATGGSTSACK
jgi:hypothetical protein